MFFVTRGCSDHCWSSSAVNVERQRKRSLLRDQILVSLGDCDKAAFLCCFFSFIALKHSRGSVRAQNRCMASVQR